MTGPCLLVCSLLPLFLFFAYYSRLSSGPTGPEAKLVLASRPLLACWSTKSFHGCSFSLERAQLRCICAESPSTTVLLSWLMGISCLLPVSSHLVVCFMREKAEAFISRESEKTELLAQARSDKRAGGGGALSRGFIGS